MRLFWDESNHQSLCIGCNSYKAALLEGGFGNQGVGGSKVPTGSDCRPCNNDTRVSTK